MLPNADVRMHISSAESLLASCCSFRCKQDEALQVEEGFIWTFEQEQSLVGSQVNTTIRMTAVKLSSGGLLLYSPVAPTQ